MSSIHVYYGNTYIKVGTIERRLPWALRKDDTKIREAVQISTNLKRQWRRTLAIVLICWDGVDSVVCCLKLRRVRACCSYIVLQHGRTEREQMPSFSVLPQAQSVLLVTKFRLPMCGIIYACLLPRHTY